MFFLIKKVFYFLFYHGEKLSGKLLKIINYINTLINYMFQSKEKVIIRRCLWLVLRHKNISKLCLQSLLRQITFIFKIL